MKQEKVNRLVKNYFAFKTKLDKTKIPVLHTFIVLLLFSLSCVYIVVFCYGFFRAGLCAPCTPFIQGCVLVCVGCVFVCMAWQWPR